MPITRSQHIHLTGFTEIVRRLPVQCNAKAPRLQGRRQVGLNALCFLSRLSASRPQPAQIVDGRMAVALKRSDPRQLHVSMTELKDWTLEQTWMQARLVPPQPVTKRHHVVAPKIENSLGRGHTPLRLFGRDSPTRDTAQLGSAV